MNLSQTLTQQGTVFTLLGRVFIHELDKTTIQTLQEPKICEVMDQFHSGFSDYIQQTDWNDENINQLASDYCHLFILPQKTGLSLQASHWLLSDETLDMAKLESIIESLNIDLSSLHISDVNLPKDHLGLLLYFVSALFCSNDPKVQALANQVANVVLIPWTLRFVEKLSTATNNPVYLACGQLLLESVRYLEAVEAL
jgi:TorA maturation chaperone TorD